MDMFFKKMVRGGLALGMLLACGSACGKDPVITEEMNEGYTKALRKVKDDISSKITNNPEFKQKKKDRNDLSKCADSYLNRVACWATGGIIATMGFGFIGKELVKMRKSEYFYAMPALAIPLFYFAARGFCGYLRATKKYERTAKAVKDDRKNAYEEIAKGNGKDLVSSYNNIMDVVAKKEGENNKIDINESDGAKLGTFCKDTEHRIYKHFIKGNQQNKNYAFFSALQPGLNYKWSQQPFDCSVCSLRGYSRGSMMMPKPTTKTIYHTLFKCLQCGNTELKYDERNWKAQ